jgi:hypothetical protein
MRAIARFSGGFTIIALAFLTACGGGQASTSSSGSASATSLPSKSVCETFSKDTVSRIIGRAVYSANDINTLNNLNEPTTCYYYTDTEESNNVGIQWMLVKDALWSDQIAGLGTTDSGGMKTVRVRYAKLGDDAVKETTTYENVTTVGYMVLLKQRGIVVYVSNVGNADDASIVPDDAQLNLVNVVIQTAKKL